MKIALLLFGYAVFLGVVGPRVLRHGGWATRSPRLAIVSWQILSASVLISVSLAGLALVAPSAPFSTNFAAVLRACLMAFRSGYATPAGVGATLGGLVLTLGVVLRSVSCLVAGLIRSAGERSRHLTALNLVTRNCTYPETVIVQHAIPAAYCLPGRHRRVVLTSAAIEALDDHQLQAVLAHERAHLSGCHHLVLEAAKSLHRAFPRIPLFSQASTEISRLVELAADDVAAVRYGRLSVATAMVTMSRGAAPSMALGAGGAGALERVHRLLQPAHPLKLAVVATGFALAISVLLMPVVAAVTPAWSAARMSACPMTTPVSFVSSINCHSSHALSIAKGLPT